MCANLATGKGARLVEGRVSRILLMLSETVMWHLKLKAVCPWTVADDVVIRHCGRIERLEVAWCQSANPCQ